MTYESDRNFGRELGELRGGLEGLGRAFDDFRAETRQDLRETRQDLRELKDLITAGLQDLRTSHASRLESLELWRASVKGKAKFGAWIVGGGGAIAAAWRWLGDLFSSGPPPAHGGP